MIKGITAYAASQGANKQASCEPSALQEAGQAAWSSAPPLDAAPSSWGSRRPFFDLWTDGLFHC